MADKTDDSLTGLFFLGTDDTGCLMHQGLIGRYIRDGHYLVELLGDEDAETLVHISQMVGWRLFHNPAELRQAVESAAVPRRPTQPQARLVRG